MLTCADESDYFIAIARLPICHKSVVFSSDPLAVRQSSSPRSPSVVEQRRGDEPLAALFDDFLFRSASLEARTVHAAQLPLQSSYIDCTLRWPPRTGCTTPLRVLFAPPLWLWRHLRCSACCCVRLSCRSDASLSHAVVRCLMSVSTRSSPCRRDVVPSAEGEHRGWSAFGGGEPLPTNVSGFRNWSSW